jgi:hypothetical protein
VRRAVVSLALSLFAVPPANPSSVRLKIHCVGGMRSPYVGRAPTPRGPKRAEAVRTCELTVDRAQLAQIC